MQPEPGSNVAQLKDDIDSGRTGDKVAGLDPGAAPLGTDEEAGGAAPSPALIARMRQVEREGRPNSATANAAEPRLAPDARMPKGPLWLPILIGVLAALAFAVGLWVALR